MLCSLNTMWIKAKPVCPSKSCHVTLNRTVLLFGNAVFAFSFAPFLITQNCFDITWHKVKQCPLRERIGGKSLKLRSVWGMLIYLETESGDVVIKDSISQRSVWFNRTLPLTDGVFLTSALLRFACHKHYYGTRHLPEINHPSQSWGLMQTQRTVFKWLWRSIRLLIHYLVYVVTETEAEAGMCLQLKQQSPERLPSRIIFMERELFPCIIPTCVPVGQQGFF